MNNSKIKYDEMIVVASNKPNLLQIVRWGKGESSWRFLLTIANNDPFETGKKYSSKKEIIKDSYKMALHSNSDYFNESHLIKLKNNKWIQLNDDEVDSLLHLNRNQCDVHILNIIDRL